MVRLKKQLGQHLLKDQTAIAAITSAVDPKPTDIILEIGPGTGNLTTSLIPESAKAVVLEKDEEMIEALHERFPDEIKSKKLEIIAGDALEFNPELLKEKNTNGYTYKLAGNVPYNITGALFEHFLSAKLQPERLVFLIQKEVADRIMAREGKHSILSLSVHVYGNPKMVRKVPAGAFNPPPKVDSAVIAIYDISRNRFIDDDHEALFFQIIKTGFAHPRKFALSNLASIFTRSTLEAVWEELSLNPKIRPEDLSLDGWISISKNLYTDAYGNAQ